MYITIHLIEELTELHCFYNSAIFNSPITSWTPLHFYNSVIFNSSKAGFTPTNIFVKQYVIFIILR